MRNADECDNAGVRSQIEVVATARFELRDLSFPVADVADDAWNQLLDTEPARIAELKKRAREEREPASKHKRFDWGDGQ